MWIQTTRGFYSATETFEDAELLQVRARDKQDLENLRPFIPGMRILHTPKRDYEWRVIVDKEEWADVVSQLVLDVSYNNFKDEVTKVQGHARHDIYMDVWTVLGRIGKPYRGVKSFRHESSLRNAHKPTMAELFRDTREEPWEEEGMTKAEWDAQTDDFLEATVPGYREAVGGVVAAPHEAGCTQDEFHTGQCHPEGLIAPIQTEGIQYTEAELKATEEKVSFNGRSPVPAHWASAKASAKKSRRNRKRANKRT